MSFRTEECCYMYYHLSQYWTVLFLATMNKCTELRKSLVTQRARVRSPVGTGFLGGFFGVFPHLWDKCQEALVPQGPRHNQHYIFAFLEWMGVWMVRIISCLCCLGCGPGIDLITQTGRPSRSLCGQKKYVCDPELIPSPDRSWLLGTGGKIK